MAIKLNNTEHQNLENISDQILNHLVTCGQLNIQYRGLFKSL